ncbi:phosphotransferase family protein [Rhodococcus qingshengii]|jgi:aminoglycoside phosphotransferase (APT) family kinase protein|uniref:phosphotransferase family protein n=1 Tax=Rhodococcus TaxID=1827 RepID=UPI0005AAC536|nr:MULTISPECIES: phosphotransferase family protein [Rhodococcus]MCE4268393.1 phosphotransferase family protein [Rhodococcus globerulus]MDJ0491253.1 phosphotransferase family protein [Rhodococcus qingshengii]
MTTSARSTAMDMADPHVEETIDLTLTRKLARRGVVVHTNPSASDIQDRLTVFLGSRIQGEFRLTNLSRLPGGASKEQFFFDIEWTRDGERATDRMVLRMDPPASMVETPRSREFEVLRALGDTLPVPAVHWATEDVEDLGSASMICGYVGGTASPSDTSANASGLGTTYGARLRPVLGEQFVAYLAELHRFDWSTHELPSFERPREGTTDAVDWRLGAWDRAWREDSFESHPTVAMARQWLWENRPTVDHVSLVHGDYRNGNFLFDEESGQITAVLDWELTYLGDRHHDLAYAMMEGWGEHDEETGEFYCSGLLTREQLIGKYEELSGLTVDPVRLEYYTVLNMYWAVIALIAGGPRNAAERMTHLDVMQNYLSGLGAYYLAQLNEIVGYPQEQS